MSICSLGGTASRTERPPARQECVHHENRLILLWHVKILWLPAFGVCMDQIYVHRNQASARTRGRANARRRSRVFESDARVRSLFYIFSAHAGVAIPRIAVTRSRPCRRTFYELILMGAASVYDTHPHTHHCRRPQNVNYTPIYHCARARASGREN